MPTSRDFISSLLTFSTVLLNEPLLGGFKELMISRGRPREGDIDITNVDSLGIVFKRE